MENANIRDLIIGFDKADKRLQSMEIDILDFFSRICEDLVSVGTGSDLINRYLDFRFDLESF